jgi:acyl-CoA dehydrogenase
MTMDDDLSSIIAEQADRQFRDLLSREALEAASAGRWQPALWDSVESSGLSLALVPEAHGGAGLAATDAFGIVRLSGYRGLPLPLGDTLVAKALWSAAGGELALPGDRPILLGTQPGGLPAVLHETAAGPCVSGILEPVAFGDVAGSLLLHAKSEAGEDVLLLLDLQALAGEPCVGPGPEAQHAFRLDRVAVPAERRRSWRPGHALALHAHGALLRSVQMVGAMQRSLELGLQYAAERSQFGKAIARFAPVQDMLVEAAAETAAAITASNLALAHWQLPGGDAALFCIAAAKSRCGEAAGKVSALVHQVHGAIGFTQEHVLHHHTRRLWAWRDDFGAESFWSRWLGEQVCAAPGDELWQRIASL